MVAGCFHQTPVLGAADAGRGGPVLFSQVVCTRQVGASLILNKRNRGAFSISQDGDHWERERNFHVQCGDITSQGERWPLSRCSCRPTISPQGTGQNREAAGATASLPYRRGPLSPTCASGKKHGPCTPGILPSRFRSRLFLALAGACPLRNLGPEAGFQRPRPGRRQVRSRSWSPA